MSEKLDLTSLRDALTQLEKTYTQAMTPAVKSNADVFNVYRTATIKSFEYTYALSLKFMERFIEEKQPSEIAAALSDAPITFHELLRFALDYNLISSIQRWSDYRKKRNVTSHGYNPAVAEDIISAVPDFIQEAKSLLAALESGDRQP